MPRRPTPAGEPRAAVYLRVSSAEQAELGSSLATQEERCRAHAAEQGWRVVAVERDVHTGTQLRQRPGMSRLRDLVRSGAVDVVLAYATDRMARNQAHLYIVADEAEQHGARLAFVTESFEDSAVGRFIRSASAFAAEVEREKIVERSTRARHARVRAGKLLPGCRPTYGYQYTSDRTAYVVDPVTAPVVQRIFALVLAGHPIRAIAMLLTREGVRTPTGVNPAWRESTLAHILANEWYTGQARGLRYATDAEAVDLPEGTVPALVTPEDFAAVRAVLASNRARSARNNHHPEGALLRGGLARCGYCGAAMHVGSARPQHAAVYRCGRGCRQHAIAVAALDRLVWAWTRRLWADPRLVDDALATWGDGAPRGELASVDRALAELARRRRNLVDELALLDDPGDRAAVRARLTEVGRQHRQAEQERARLSIQTTGHDARSASLAALRQRYAGRLAADWTYADQRDALEALGVRVWIWHADHAPRGHARARPWGPDGPALDRLVGRRPAGWVLPAGLE